MLFYGYGINQGEGTAVFNGLKQTSLALARSQRKADPQVLSDIQDYLRTFLLEGRKLEKLLAF